MESGHVVPPHGMITNHHHTPLAMAATDITPELPWFVCEVCTVPEHSAHNKTDTMFSVRYKLRLKIQAFSLFICTYTYSSTS
jgi:hypothetical protein